MYRILFAVLLLQQMSWSQQVTPVFVKKARSEEIANKISVSGNLNPAKIGEVAGIEAGRVEEIRFKVGDIVKSGQILARVDDRRIKHDIDENKAELVRVSTAVMRLSQEMKVQMADLAALESAESKYKGAVSEKEMRAAKLLVSTTTASLAESKATQVTIEVRIKKLNTALNDCTITAPFDGVIVERHVIEGAWLAVGGRVATLQSYELEALIEVPENIKSSILTKENLLIYSQDENALSVKEIRIKPEVDRQSRNYGVIAVLEERKNLIPGMSIKAEIPTSEKEQHLLVPTDGIQRNVTGYFVYKVIPGKEGKMVVPVTVQYLFRHGNESVIKSGGIVAGDEIVVEGNERLFPMTPVTATLREQ